MYFSVVLCIDATLFDLTIAPLQTLHLLIKLIFQKKIKHSDEIQSNCYEKNLFNDEYNEVMDVYNLKVDKFDGVSLSSNNDDNMLDSKQSSLSPSFSSPKSIVCRRILRDDSDLYSEFVEMSDSDLNTVLPKCQFDNYIECCGSKGVSDDPFSSLPFKSFVGDEFSECNLTDFSHMPFTDLIKDGVSKLKCSKLDSIKDEFKHAISFEKLRNNISNTNVEHGMSKLYGLSEFFNCQPSIPERIGAVRFFVIILSFLMFSRIDTSRVYHYIRGQPFIKLYVIFNMLEMFERLCRTLGRDLFDLLSKSMLQCLETSNSKKQRDSNKLSKQTISYYFSKDNHSDANFNLDEVESATESDTYKWVRFGLIFFLVTLHSLIHTFMHLIRVMSLNIAINSSEVSTGIFTVYVIVNFSIYIMYDGNNNVGCDVFAACYE